MSKLQFIHVIIRLMGFGFVITALWLLQNFVTGMMLASQMPTSPSLTMPIVIDAMIRITLAFALGVYLLVDGRVVIRLLDNEGN